MLRLTLVAGFAAVALTSIASVVPASAQAQPCTAGPQCKPNGGSSSYECGDSLGFLRRVYPAEVAGIDDNHRVWITEICVGHSLMRSDGNAAGLRNTIAQNDVLIEALQRKSFSANDVFAVRMMGDDTINLYVNTLQDYR